MHLEENHKWLWKNEEKGQTMYLLESTVTETKEGGDLTDPKRGIF
jgi:hypothetical protein